MAFLTLTLAPSITPDNTSALTGNATMSVGVDESLSLRIVEYNEETGEWDIDTSEIGTNVVHGDFASAVVKVIASTNGLGGYTLSLSDVDNNNALTSPRNITSTIPSLSSSITLDDITDTTEKFPIEKWGYSWAKNSDTSSLTFNSVPLNNATAIEKQKDSTNESGSNSYTFTLGVRVSTDTIADTYSDQIMFSLVGNPSPTSPLFFRTQYMQQFTPQICNTVKAPLPTTTEVTTDNGGNYFDDGTYASRVPSTTIIDQRDNQTYTIRKLADGNCWMTENLRLGKEGAVTLDSTNSNMVSGRTFALPAAKTVAEYEAKVAQDGKGWTWGNQAEYPFVFYRDSNPAAVNPTVKPEGITPDSPSALYNWYTATAGALDSDGNSLMTTASGQAVDSVCPKNWQLPVNGSGTGTTRSYMNLVNIYTSAPGNSYADINSSAGQAAINTTNIIKLLDKPTSFVYSDLYFYGGTLFSRPLGSYWSSSVSSAVNSYSLRFDTNGTTRSLAPQYADNKGDAFAVRCVAS